MLGLSILGTSKHHLQSHLIHYTLRTGRCTIHLAPSILKPRTLAPSNLEPNPCAPLQTLPADDDAVSLVQDTLEVEQALPALQLCKNLGVLQAHCVQEGARLDDIIDAAGVA
jgi:hypothetical protein